MSRLLIPQGGQPSKRLAKGTGLVVAPQSHISQMKYQVLGGNVHSIVAGSNMLSDDDIVSIYFVESGNVLYQRNHGTVAAGSTKTIAASGLDLGMGNGEKIELAPIYKSSTIEGPRKKDVNYFEVGSSPAFFIKCKFLVTTKNKLVRMFVGFRKLEADRDTITDYDEMYGATVTPNSSADKIQEFKILNGVATSEVDTSLTNTAGTAQTIEVRVSASGVATILVDGVLLTSNDHSINGLTFDDGELVIPFIRVNNDSGNDAGVFLQELIIGSQAADV